MSDDLAVGNHFVIPGAELDILASRSSGPGGQHVNTTSTRVTLRWQITESAVLTHAQFRRIKARLGNRISKEGYLAVSSDTRRSQLKNRDDVRERLATMLREALTIPKRRRKTKPSRGANERRLKAKKQRSGLKSDRRKRYD